jgi:hypothetical protein
LRNISFGHSFDLTQNSVGFKMASYCKMLQKTINNKKIMLSLKIVMATIQAKIDPLPSNKQKRMLFWFKFHISRGQKDIPAAKFPLWKKPHSSNRQHKSSLLYLAPALLFNYIRYYSWVHFNLRRLVGGKLITGKKRALSTQFECELRSVIPPWRPLVCAG